MKIFIENLGEAIYDAIYVIILLGIFTIVFAGLQELSQLFLNSIIGG